MSKPRIPFWFEKPEGDEPPTVAQLEKLLASADSDIKIAQGLEARAREKEAAERTVSAVEATESAMAETARLQRFRQALVADLDAAKKRAHEAELVRLRERKTKLEALLSHAALTEAVRPLVDREVAALRQVAAIRLERQKLHGAKAALAHELQTIKGTFGEEVHWSLGHDPVWQTVSPTVVDEAIDLMRREVGEELWPHFEALKPERIVRALAALDEARARAFSGR